MLITREILEGYLNCKYKGYLKLTGQRGTISDLEALMEVIRAESLKKCEEKMVARFGCGKDPTGVRVSLDLLKQGAPLILGGLIQDDELDLGVDALVRIGEPSRLGAFQYAPALIYEREKVESNQRQLLDICSAPQKLDRCIMERPVPWRGSIACNHAVISRPSSRPEWSWISSRGFSPRRRSAVNTH